MEHRGKGISSSDFSTSPAGAGKGGLRPGFSPLGMWALSIGTSIGWGSFIVTCNTYLQKSGILGTIFGLLAGMAVIFVITWNLQFMIRSSPGAGGVYTFEKKIGGKDLGFLALWFVLLTYLAILWANITSVPLFARFFLGNTFRFGFRYSIFGYEVWFGEALLSIIAVILTGLLCSRSSRLPGWIIVAAALIFTVGFAICAVIVMVKHDSNFSYSPFFTEGSGAFAQIVRTAVISPWAFIGFENVSHFSEEYSFPVKKIKGVLISSVLATTVLYIFVSLLSVSAYPHEYASWLDYIRDMGNLSGIKAVPAFYAAGHYLGSGGIAVLMLSLLCVILTSLIGNMLALSRLLYSAGREGEAPGFLSQLNEKGIPHKAILTVVAISVFIPFLGRTAIGWIVDVTTLGATLIYGMISHAVFLLARRKNRRAEQVTGAAGIFLMVCFLLLLLIPGLLPFDAMEMESYILFIVWSVLGLSYFRRLIRKDRGKEHDQRVIVWIFLLVMVLFASMMWVSRATEDAANEAIDRIFQYHESHEKEDPDENAGEERAVFLREQANQISSTNTLYSIVSLGLFFLLISIMLQNYQDTRRMGERLTEAEKAARDAEKIAKLKESISALLDNMPALSFSKDVSTGVYLACNQAFAEYANKANPEGVVGLTDTQIFDPVTAKHFVEDDLKALSMDRPYIFFEDVLDAAGKPRQFQTTKLKFTDASGRLCTLGMCQDVTELLAHQQKERQADTMITAMSSDYHSVFYINLEKDEVICYRVDQNTAGLGIEEGGVFAFSSTIADYAGRYVAEEDREDFLAFAAPEHIRKELERETVIAHRYRIRKEGEERFELLRIAGVRDSKDQKGIREAGMGFCDVDRETRESIAHRNALRDALSAAEEANRAKTVFLSNMSHEIRTPMNAIIGLDSIALRDETLPAHTRRELEKIGSSARHLLSLINDILDMSRIESGRMVLKEERFSVRDLMDQIDVIIGGQCEDKGLTYVYDRSGLRDQYFLGDDLKLKQVIINILGNSVKFTDAPGTITFIAEQEDSGDDRALLSFTMKDTGIGMDKEFLPKLFESFSQENTSASTKYGGSGLGMSISKSIVEMMGGEISVESQVGVGTSFYVRIPLGKVSGAEQEAVAGKESELKNPVSEISFEGRNMLIAEDQEMNAEVLADLLELEDMTSEWARNGKIAVEMFEKSQPGHYDAILMDMRMPVMDGITATRMIRALDRPDASQIPIIALTANAFEEDARQCLEAGMNAHLSKPLDIDLLKKALSGLLS